MLKTDAFLRKTLEKRMTEEFLLNLKDKDIREDEERLKRQEKKKTENTSSLIFFITILF